MSSFFNVRSLVLTVAILFIVLVILIHEVFYPVTRAERVIPTLTLLQSKSLDYLVEMNKLIISLALIVIGACAAILVRKYPNIKVKTALTSTVLLFCILFAASSIFSGYALYDNLVVSLSDGYFNPDNEMIRWPQRLQFYSFFVSVVLFGLFIITYFLRDETESEPEDKKPLLVKIVDTETGEKFLKKGAKR